MYRLTDAMRRAVLLSLIPVSGSNLLKEMVNRYQFRYQDLLREVTEEVFTKANNDVILEAFHTVKPSSLTRTPREFINFAEQFLALGRRVRDGITQRQAKHQLLDVIVTMKVDGLLKEILKEETQVGLEFNYLEMIIYVMNPLMSRHKLAIKKGHIMRRLGYAIPEAPQPKPKVPPQRTWNKNGSGPVRGMALAFSRNSRWSVQQSSGGCSVLLQPLQGRNLPALCGPFPLPPPCAAGFAWPPFPISLDLSLSWSHSGALWGCKTQQSPRLCLPFPHAGHFGMKLAPAPARPDIATTWSSHIS